VSWIQVQKENSISICEGIYTVKLSLFLFKSIELKDKVLKANTNLGTISLSEDAH
jgi:hypothetical protein